MLVLTRHLLQRSQLKELTTLTIACAAFSASSFDPEALNFLIGRTVELARAVDRRKNTCLSLSQLRFRQPLVVLGFEDRGLCARHTSFRTFDELETRIQTFPIVEHETALVPSSVKLSVVRHLDCRVPTTPKQIAGGGCDLLPLPLVSWGCWTTFCLHPCLPDSFLQGWVLDTFRSEPLSWKKIRFWH